MNEQTLSFPFQARYYKLGEITNSTRAVWFVLHGYGQLAKYFLPKFSLLAEHNICVIAPEGLSRFYLEDIQSRLQSGNNRVGATWMTRENREMDIVNYLQYLDTVYNRELSNQKVPVAIVGFSQGAATASRWAIKNSVGYDQLILWAGIFPPDMDFHKGHDVLDLKLVRMVYGTKDPYIDESRMEEMSMLTSKLRIKPEIIPFDGGHEIDPDTLLKLI